MIDQIKTRNLDWEMTILDSCPEGLNGYEAMAVGDIDGDGELEAVCGGCGGLNWYRPYTGEKGTITKDIFNSVGLVCHDIDGDGIVEVCAFESPYGSHEKSRITWFKWTGEDWARYEIDPNFPGVAHDIVFADVDNDGEDEIVTISCYSCKHGVYILKRGSNLTMPWSRTTVDEVIHKEASPFSEGVSVADIDGDGTMEIINGPYYHKLRGKNPYNDSWERIPYAHDFREMCRTQVMDITGNGRPDIIITDSEFMDGKLSWFENLGTDEDRVVFQEHVLAEDLYYSHTLQVYEEEGYQYILVGEMEKGGWDAPYQYDARLLRYATCNHGKEFERQLLYCHEGTHEAKIADFNHDGKMEVVGKTLGRDNKNPRVQYFSPASSEKITERFEHIFIDRYKESPGIEIMVADVDGNGENDIICGKYWYQSPAWNCFTIPGINQVILAYDVDEDGRDELIAIRNDEEKGEEGFFGSVLVVLKPVDPIQGLWNQAVIGYCDGDWPHGSVMDRFLPDDKAALICSYHSCNMGKMDYPQMFIPGDNPMEGYWEKKAIAPIPYGEELLALDVTGDGRLDIIAGKWWLENKGDGTFSPHVLYEDDNLTSARTIAMDVDGDGITELVMVSEDVDYVVKKAGFSRVVWLKRGENPKEPWNLMNIDSMRSPHSIGGGDLDGDGQPEFVVAEHDPFYPYRNRGRAYIYKPVMGGRGFKRYLLDHRFEHHDGMKVVPLFRDRTAILSHAWNEYGYVHLWVEKKQEEK